MTEENEWFTLKTDKPPAACEVLVSSCLYGCSERYTYVAEYDSKQNAWVSWEFMRDAHTHLRIQRDAFPDDIWQYFYLPD